MKLRKLHVLERQAGAEHHGIAVAGARMRSGTGEVDATIPPSCKDGSVGAEAMQRPVVHIPCQQAAAGAVIVHQEIERQIFDEKHRVVLQALLVERVQDGVSGAVGRCTGALRHLLAVADGLAAERALIDFPLLGPGEGNTVMLELEHGRHGFATHVFDGILVAEPVRALDRVVHVEAPVVAVAHVAERGGHAALRRHRVAARRKHFRDAGCAQPRCGHPERSP